jgi:hypothetical protein
MAFDVISKDLEQSNSSSRFFLMIWFIVLEALEENNG